MERLKRRSDFRAVAQASGGGARAHASGFILQARAREKAGPPRVGFTVSKQVGNAVFVVFRGAGHSVGNAQAQVLPHAIEWVWKGYAAKKDK